MNQLGTVLAFKPGVTDEQIQEAFKAIIPLIDPGSMRANDPTKIPIHSFNPEWGYPVWYLP